MKAERGYFRIGIDGDAHWVASEIGMWLLHPELGLRKMEDAELIAGHDLLKEIELEAIKKVKEFCNEK